MCMQNVDSIVDIVENFIDPRKSFIHSVVIKSVYDFCLLNEAGSNTHES